MFQSVPWDQAEAYPKPQFCHSPFPLLSCFLHPYQFVHKSHTHPHLGLSIWELILTLFPCSSHSDSVEMFTSFLYSNPSIGFSSHQEKKENRESLPWPTRSPNMIFPSQLSDFILFPSPRHPFHPILTGLFDILPNPMWSLSRPLYTSFLHQESSPPGIH